MGVLKFDQFQIDEKCFKIVFLLYYFSCANLHCSMVKVDKKGLNNKRASIYSVKHRANGLQAKWDFSLVRHEGCSGGGSCAWIFRHCRDNEFILESAKYRGSKLYANVVSAVSHFDPG